MRAIDFTTDQVARLLDSIHEHTNSPDIFPQQKTMNSYSRRYERIRGKLTRTTLPATAKLDLEKRKHY